MRVEVYGAMDNKVFADAMETIQKKNRRNKLEIVEGISNKTHVDTVARRYCEEMGIDITQFVPKWNDLTGCKFPKTNKFGTPYNPGAAQNRDDKMMEYTASAKKKMLLIFYNKDDRFVGYHIWLAEKNGVPVLLYDTETGRMAVQKNNNTDDDVIKTKNSKKKKATVPEPETEESGEPATSDVTDFIEDEAIQDAIA